MRKTLLLLTLAVVVLLFGQTGRVLGYALEGQKWPNGYITMNLQLSSATVPYPLQSNQYDEPGLQDYSASWNAVAIAALTDWNQYLANVQFASTTKTGTPRNGDKINSVFFDSTAFGQSFGTDTIAITVRTFDPKTKTMTGADVVVNSARSWDSYRGPLQSDYLSVYTYDLRRVLDHEFGHVLGLDHPDLATPPQDVAAIMNSVISDLDHIAQDDVDGAMALYGPKIVYEPITVVSNSAGGTVTGSGSFLLGSTQQITATPMNGYEFLGWDDGSTNPTRTIVVPPGGATYQAGFGIATGAWTYAPNFPNIALDATEVIFAKNQFYAFGFSGMATSPDGITWTGHASVGGSQYGDQYVAYGNGIFVSVFSGTSMTSTDGYNWTAQTTPLVNVNGVAFGNGIFVAPGTDFRGNSFFMTSTDGANWTVTSQVLSGGYTPNGIAYGNGMFVSTAIKSGSNDVSFVSHDGVNWTSAQTFNQYNLRVENYGQGHFCAIAGGYSLILTSTDGLHWGYGYSPGDGINVGQISAVGYGNGLFIALADTYILYSTATLHWPELTEGNFNNGTAVAYGNGVFVGAYGGQTVYSVSPSSQPPVQPTVTSSLTGTAFIGTPYTYQITGAQSPNAYNAFGLPPGLSIDQLTGTITGTPTTNGTFPVTLYATNDAGSGTATLTLTVSAPPSVFLGGLNFTYDGRPHPTTATTSPADLPVTFTYNGSSTPPTAVGTYNVVATVNNSGVMSSASGTLTIAAVLPTVTTENATGISPTGATFNGITDPKTADTTVYFQFGATSFYGLQTAPQDAGLGAVNVNFSTLFSRAPQTTAMTYHYRAVAQNAAGTVYGADKSFTIGASPGIVTNPQAALGASGAEVNLTVNPAGLALTVYFQYGTTTAYGSTTTLQNLGKGIIPVNLFTLFSGLAPNTPYHYRLVMTNASGTTYGPDETFTTLSFDTTLVAQKGDAAAGTPTTFASFGPPALNVHDGVAFTGMLAPGNGITSANNLGIWADDNGGTRRSIAQTGTLAADTGGNFLTLSDPVYNDAGSVAFRATLKPLAGQVTAATAAGVWTTASGSLHLMARQGDPAAGTSGTFATFLSVGLSESAGPIIYATLNRGTGISAANNAGIWEGNNAQVSMLRLGETIGGETIAKLAFLPAENYVNGQTRSFNTNGNVICHATFTDKKTGLVQSSAGTPQVDLLSGVPATPINDANYAAFGNPTINDNDRIAYQATLTNSVIAIFAQNSIGTRIAVARTGSTAPGTVANFASFSDPIYNNNQAIAFRAALKVASGQATATTATGIWASDGNLDSLALIARQGVTQAPGCPLGATFATFTEMALPDQGGSNNNGGVIFLGTLNINAAAGVSKANNTGIWAVDSNGDLQLIVRTGDVLMGKTVTALSFLPSPAYVNGTSRSFAHDSGDLVYLATFSDKSTAIFNVVYP